MHIVYESSYTFQVRKHENRMIKQCISEVMTMNFEIEITNFQYITLRRQMCSITLSIPNLPESCDNA